MTMQTYLTSFCNQPHDLKDGVPVGHRCFVLDPKALAIEARGDMPLEGLEIVALPRREHKGRAPFRVGDVVLMDGRIDCEATVLAYFPVGSTSYAFPHCKLDVRGGDKNAAGSLKRLKQRGF